jgi:hypothetical protein
VLKTQEIWVNGRIETVGNLQLPLSEGIVNPRYGFVGVQLVLNALKRQPLLYSLGMGGLQNPYPRLLIGLKWPASLVPFFFRVVKPYRFLRRIRALRTSATRRLGLDVMAVSGAGWVGTRLLQGMTRRRGRRRPHCNFEAQGSVGDWADRIWEAARSQYMVVATRDRSSLETLYGGSALPGLTFLRMTWQGKEIGWAAVLDTRMSDHRYFGNLRVGTIVDGFALPDDAPAVIRAATSFLERAGVDLVVSNQSHHAWVKGLRESGFLAGPSNFALALAKAFVAKIPSCEEKWCEFHFNRGDGDGPINL